MSTIKDVARIAGVSPATVSHVVNRTRYVSPELVKRVEDAINSLEYPPNFVVKRYRGEGLKAENRYIALLASDLHNPFQKDVEHRISEILDLKGYTLIPFNYCKDDGILDFFCDEIAKNREFHGAVIFAGNENGMLEEKIRQFKMPLVVVGASLAAADDCDIILSDNCDGAYKAAKHLIRSGHENIAIICADAESEANSQRITGCKKALSDNGMEIKDEFIISGIEDDEQIFVTLSKLFAAVNPPTALFVANYRLAIPVFRFMNKNNISCPEDLSVVCFNDFDWAELHTPPVTTVSQNISKIGETAAEFLIERMKQASDDSEIKLKARKEIISTELKVRGSTTGIGRGPFGEKAASADVLQLSDAERHIIMSGNYTAAISFHYMGKEWMRLHEKGIKEVFASLGIHILAITDAHFNPEMQSKQLRSLLSLERDIIISIPTDNVKTADAFRAIADSKTGLVLISNVPQGLSVGDYISCISVNERSQGRIAGRGLGEYMMRHNKRNVGIIRHGADFYATNQRDNAAEQIISEEFPELNICASVEFDTEESAYEQTKKLIKEHPETEGIYISWEGPAMRGLDALDELERNDIAVATADLEYPLALNMARGGAVKAISSQCPYEQGQAIAFAAASHILGKRVPSFIGIEPIQVTAENLLKSLKRINKAEPPEEIIKALKGSLESALK